MNQNTLEKFFRNGSDGKRSFSKTAESWQRFSSLCRDIIQGKKDFQSAHLHVWLWIPKHGEMPLRLPVIIVPSLEIMRWLLRAGITPPKLVVYQATGVISHINNIDPTEAQWISEAMESQLSDFLQANFPELWAYVVFQFWEQDNDEETLENIQKYATATTSILTRESHEHFKKCESHNSNNDGKYELYVSANSYYNGGFEEYPILHLDSPETVIPIWGRSETKFFQTLLETQQSCRNILPLITQVWAFPSYYPNPKWDVMSREDLEKFESWDISLHPDIAKDLSTLNAYKI